MSVYDVRDSNSEETRIRWCTDHDLDITSTGDNDVLISDLNEGGSVNLLISGREDALNLIKALKQAIALGWLND